MQTDFPRYRFGWIFLASLGVVLLTRLPILPTHLYSFDSVNLALALEDFNPVRNQPQPPGYPFFVGVAKLLNLLLGDPWLVFTVLRLLVAALAVALVFWLGRAVRSAETGVAAAALLCFAPTFWYSSLTSSLRIHLALISVGVALPLWRALELRETGGAAARRWYYAAAIVLGISGGFRPEAEIALAPLLVWAGWRLGGWRMAARGVALMIPPTLIWLGVLVMAMGGPSEVLAQFGKYAQEQGGQSSVLIQAPQLGWRRMAARAAIWTFIGALAWVWALPWLRRDSNWSALRPLLTFLSWWFIPAYLFNVIVHTADPDHTLLTLPPLCLLGGVCLAILEERIPAASLAVSLGKGLTVWMAFLALLPMMFVVVEPHGKNLAMFGVLITALLLIRPRFVAAAGIGAQSAPSLRRKHPLLLAALAINVPLFFTEFPLPAGRLADGSFHPLRSASDAALIGTYETSYRRVSWTDLMTDYALRDIEKMRAEQRRDMVVVWMRDGAPDWRKITFYHPNLNVVVLEESGDPAAPATRAVFWRGKDIQRQVRGAAPIRIDVPAGGRLVWLLAGGREKELGQVVQVRKATAVFYTDMPAQGAQFQWGSFEFVAPPTSADAAPVADATRDHAARPTVLAADASQLTLP
jgi:hypothetical protein